MNYGMTLSASGVLTNSYRMDVFSHNLANAQTPAFKPDLAAVMQRRPERLEDAAPPNTNRQLIERLGGGVLAAPQSLSTKPGTLQPTGRPLDVALTDVHQFLVVQQTTANGSVETRLTRHGNLQPNATGQLVTHNGHPVLGANGTPIHLPRDARVSIDFAGRITDDQGNALGQLRVAHVDDPSALQKQGDSLYAAPANLTNADAPALKPSHLEGSAVDPIQALMDLIGATKALQANARMITHQDQLMDRAINTFGRVV